MPRKSFFALFAALLLLGAACGDEADKTGAEAPKEDDEFNQPFADAEAYPVFASPEVAVGENRFILGLLNKDDAPIGSPDIDLHVAFFDLAKSDQEPVFEKDMEWVWIEEGVRGIYVADATFDSPGKWGAEVTITGDSLDENVKANFDVAAKSTTPDIGDEVPPSETPTAADVGKLSEISTDEHPDPDFYELSVAGALKAKKPFVLIFSTPKFCQSATCGPILDITKAVAKDFPDVNFIHVEPYDLNKVPNLEPVDSVMEWGLPSEPYVFVVGSNGTLVAEFAVAMAPDELVEVLKKL